MNALDLASITLFWMTVGGYFWVPCRLLIGLGLLWLARMADEEEAR